MTADHSRHRGAHPQDRLLFAESNLATLRLAVHDLSWLLSRGYPPDASLKLVGDRYLLKSRQRDAVRQSACSDQALEARCAALHPPEAARGRVLAIDGFNLLILLEAAMGGGVVFRGRDGCLRDLSSVHGTYRQVEETRQAALLVGQCLARVGVEEVLWLLDRPVSNSGRLAVLLRELAREHGWPWSVELEFNPDRRLATSQALVVSGDAAVLDAGVAWVNLGAQVVQTQIPHAWLVDLA
jgi:hypothetical protein